ncbi:MAG: AbrB/MazE/SpoVT family DNA-binding domain-containing protein [Gemmatimonadota bacterium]|nr:AbrB/MazE/SpoVT family DNA-binding domain-containing protein [Gemmatimonadota bacterium]
MPTAKSRTFRSGNSEAVRLPKDVAFGEDIELIVVRSGDVITMYPAVSSIPEMIAQLGKLPVPTNIERRELQPIPERDGI